MSKRIHFREQDSLVYFHGEEEPREMKNYERSHCDAKTHDGKKSLSMEGFLSINTREVHLRIAQIATMDAQNLNDALDHYTNSTNNRLRGHKKEVVMCLKYFRNIYKRFANNEIDEDMAIREIIDKANIGNEHAVELLKDYKKYNLTVESIEHKRHVTKDVPHAVHAHHLVYDRSTTHVTSHEARSSHHASSYDARSSHHISKDVPHAIFAHQLVYDRSIRPVTSHEARPSHHTSSYDTTSHDVRRDGEFSDGKRLYVMPNYQRKAYELEGNRRSSGLFY